MVINAARLISASATALIAAGIAAAAVVLPAPDWTGLAANISPSAPSPAMQIAQATPQAPPAPVQPQSAPSPPASTSAQPPQAQAPAPAAPQPPVARQTDAEVVFTLVRSTMVGLDQANVSGNYTVLRDIGAPGFRDKNSAADLARIFAPIRDAKIDLSAAVLLDPHISKATLNEQKMLYIVGAFDTKPLPVSFELLFEPVGGLWRIFGISVTPIGTIADAPVAKQAPKAASKPQPAKAKRPPEPKPIVPNAAGPAPTGNPK